MGIALPQVVTEDRASGAQVIDGSLKFDVSEDKYLKRTFASGNKRTWTWSAWLNKNPVLVVAPEQWFGEKLSDKNTDDISCEGWVKCS